MKFEGVRMLNKEKFLKYLELILRLWIAYVLITNAGVGTLTPLKDLGLPPHIYTIIDSMWQTGFMMHLVKVIEFTTGLMLLFNFFVPLALIALFPVVINIYGMHIFLFKQYITTGLGMILVCGLLIYNHRDKFRPLLVRK